MVTHLGQIKGSLDSHEPENVLGIVLCKQTKGPCKSSHVQKNKGIAVYEIFTVHTSSNYFNDRWLLVNSIINMKHPKRE